MTPFYRSRSVGPRSSLGIQPDPAQMAFPYEQESPESAMGAMEEVEVEPEEGMEVEGGEEDDLEDQGIKSSTDQALVVRASEVCGTCEHWLPDGSCTKVDGQFEQYDRCLRFWEPRESEDESAVMIEADPAMSEVEE